MSQNQLLEPIHGISLEDYSAACAKQANGMDEQTVAGVLGVELPVWQEVSLLWAERMKQDSTFEVITLFGQYFGQADQHPKFGNATAGTSGGGGYTAQIKSDKAFYEELEAARNIAYEYGLDGAQWIADKYGIALGDFQIAASQWNAQIHADLQADFEGYNQRQAAYRAKYQELFASAQGGNVADDISF